MPTDWTPDGNTLVYSLMDSMTQWDIWLLPMAGARQPIPFLRGSSNETDGRISPDGRWIAYVSDESGAQEVYISSFPKPGNKSSISTGGEREPEWRRDGKELFYVSAHRQLMAVPMQSADDGATLEAGIPTSLFEIPELPLAAQRYGSADFTAAADGQRFLVRVPAGAAVVPPATVVLNWPAGMRQ